MRLLDLRTVATKAFCEAPLGGRALRVRDGDTLLGDASDLVLEASVWVTSQEVCKTHLVDTPGVTVEEHLHALVEQLLGLLVVEERALAVGAGLGLERLTEERLGKVRTEAGSEGRRGVGGAEEVDVAEESDESAGNTGKSLT